MGNVRLYGATSGYTELAPPAVAPDGVLTLPSGTGTIATTTDQGLVHINTTTFSAVSSVSINNVFTSTYQNYRIVINLVSSISNEIRFRMRASGTDNTGANYAIQYTFASGAITEATRQTGQTAAWFFSSSGNYESVGAYDIGSPQLAKQTTLVGSQVYDQATIGLISWAANHDQSTAFDGITIIAGSGTMTGTIRVYGYKNS